MKRYIYVLTETRLGEILAHNPAPVEILKREGEDLTVATYQPLKGLKPVRTETVSDDWKSWKQGFGPVEVEDFVVMPPWKKPLFINPGMAFGTGQHPTTRMCLRALRKRVKPGDSLLDVGTGSGILAIASKMLGAEKVVGIDISEEAVRSARENAELNGVEIEFRVATPYSVKESFDIVVANLELGTFKEVLFPILGLFHRSLILSGIYGREELEELLSMLGHRGLRADTILEEDNWFCVGVGDGRN
jgi:ribosomal protein L11 methyltransferase